MMNTKKFLEEVEERLTRRGEDGQRLIDLVKMYIYKCAVNAREQRNMNLCAIARINRNKTAYTYVANVSASLHILRILDCVFYSEIDEMINKLQRYIWINRNKMDAIEYESKCPF